MSALRSRFGIPGVISVCALVFAMIGGAYAANDNSGDNATASAKKGPKGPKGAKGAPGPAGPAGPQGPAGPKGDKGDTGPQGETGAKGDTGAVGPAGAKGATGAQGAPGATGATGATGAAGAPGAAGSPWTAGGTLPEGATETGVYSFHGLAENVQTGVSLSFNIPLAAKLDDNNIIYGPPGTDPVNCPGTVEKPTAASGFLCIYEAFIENASISATLNFGVSGVGLRFIASADVGIGQGSWAVTG